MSSYINTSKQVRGTNSFVYILWALPTDERLIFSDLTKLMKL